MADQVNKLAFFDFYMGTMEDATETERQKRPIFTDVEMVRVRWAGNTKNEHHAPANDRSDRPVVDPNTNTKYWPKWKEHPDCIEAYQAFKRGQAVTGNGTPLEEWTTITAAKRAELKAINIFTVDQVANLDAVSMKRLGIEAPKLQEQARLYLERAAGAAVDERHAAEKEEMQRQINELRAMIEGRSEAPAKETGKRKVTKIEPDADVSNSPFFSMDDESIRLWIREADPTGDQPHHLLGHSKLVAFADALNVRLREAKSKAA